MHWVTSVYNRTRSAHRRVDRASVGGGRGRCTMLIIYMYDGCMRGARAGSLNSSPISSHISSHTDDGTKVRRTHGCLLAAYFLSLARSVLAHFKTTVPVELPHPLVSPLLRATGNLLPPFSSAELDFFSSARIDLFFLIRAM